LTILVNPLAGGGRLLERWPEVVEVLSERASVRVVTAASTTELGDEARAAAAAGRTIVVAGGDGTIHRVLNALDGHRATIGILPVGSGNDLARALGVPSQPIDAARRILIGSTAALDLVSVNGYRFATVGGVGLVADATASVERLQRGGTAGRVVAALLGEQIYLLTAAAHIAFAKHVTVAASITGTGDQGQFAWEGECHAVLVANHAQLGAGLQLPVPCSSIDGVCEVCVVPRDRRSRLVRNLLSLRRGRPVAEGALLVFRAIRAVIKCPEDVGFAADGELVEVGSRFEIAVQPAAVEVIT
jgi:diacylglycerol kinase (ATP)